MIERYTRPAMGRVWIGEHKYALWCQVETPVLEAQAKAAACGHYGITSSDLLGTAPALQPDLGGPETWAGQEGGAGQAMQAGS